MQSSTKESGENIRDADSDSVSFKRGVENDHQIMTMLEEYKRKHSIYALTSSSNQIKYCDRKYIIGIYSCPKQVLLCS